MISELIRCFKQMKQTRLQLNGTLCRRWFKGAEKFAKGSYNSFTVA